MAMKIITTDELIEKGKFLTKENIWCTTKDTYCIKINEEYHLITHNGETIPIKTEPELKSVQLQKSFKENLAHQKVSNDDIFQTILILGTDKVRK